MIARKRFKRRAVRRGVLRLLLLACAILVLAPLARADLIGTRKVLAIRVNFPDLRGAPAYDTIVSRQRGAENSFESFSYGKLNLIPTVTTEVFTMPQNATYYDNRGSALAASAQAKASAAGYAVGSANKIGYYYLVGTGLGSHAIVGGQDFWVQGSTGGATLHEMGHTFGWGHARRWAPNDQSKPLGPGEVKTADYHFMSGGGYDPTPYEKWIRGWITRRANITSDGERRIRLYTFDQKNTDPANDLRTIRVTRKNFAQEFWLGYRSQYLNNVSKDGKNDLLRQGLVVYWQRSAGSQAVMVDVHAGGGQDNHSIQPGETFSDGVGDVHFTNLGRGGVAPDEYLDVVVCRGAFAGNRDPVPTWDAPTTASIGAPFTITVTGNDPDGDDIACKWTPSLASPNASGATTRTLTYNSSGRYTVKVVVSDMRGGEAQLSRTIVVRSPDATTRVWDRGAGHNSWNDARNWTGDVLPIDDDAVSFDGRTSPNLMVALDYSTTVFDVLFSGSAPHLIEAGGLQDYVLSVTSNIENRSAATQTFRRNWVNDAGLKISLIDSEHVFRTGPGDINIETNIAGAGSVNKTGTGTLRYHSSRLANAGNAYTGLTTISDGVLVLGKNAGANSIVGDVTIGNGAGTDTLRLESPNQIKNTSTLAFDGPEALFHLNGFNETVGGVRSLALGSGLIENNGTTAPCTLTVDIANDADGEFSGLIRDGGAAPLALVKSGAADLFLGQGSTYSGGTIVSAGALLVGNTTGSATGSGAVIVESGALLGGSGAIDGEVAIEDGAALSPGDGIGTLVFGDALELEGATLMQITRDGAVYSNDLIVTPGPIVYNGLLEVDDSGTSALASGDTFKLFDAPGYSGAFDGILLPPLDDGELVWDTTRLLIDGSILVTSLQRDPARLDFFTMAGVPQSQNVILTNASTETLTITDIAIGGESHPGSFAVTAGTSTGVILMPGGTSVTLEVTFDPDVAPAPLDDYATGYMRIIESGTAGTTHAITLSGFTYRVDSFVWDGPVGGWDEATKWTPTGIPATGDMVEIRSGLTTRGAGLIVLTTDDVLDAIHDLDITGGDLLLTDGKLLVPEGRVDVSTGSIDAQASEIIVGGDEFGGSGPGTLNLSSGTLRSFGQTIVGLDGGQGVFTARDSVVDVGYGAGGLRVGYNSGVGEATVEGSTVTVAGNVDLAYSELGDGSTTASMTQSGGLVDIGGRLGLGGDKPSTATYRLDGGRLNIGTSLIVGADGRGEFYLDDGEIDIARSLLLGNDPSAQGHFEMTTGTIRIGTGKHNTLGDFSLGADGSNHTSFVMRNGTILHHPKTDDSNDGNTFNIGWRGNASMVMHDGYIETSQELIVGYGWQRDSRFEILGGEVRSDDVIRIGGDADRPANSRGTLIVSGDGRLTNGSNMRLGDADNGSSGTLVVRDNGVVETGSYLTVGRAGRGYLTVEDNARLTINSSLSLGGASTGRGTAYLRGGLIEVAGEARVGNGGVGALTISGGRLNAAVSVNLARLNGSKFDFDMTGGTLVTPLFKKGLGGSNGFNWSGGTIAADRITKPTFWNTAGVLSPALAGSVGVTEFDNSDYTQATSATLEITVDGADADQILLTNTAQATLGGTLRVDLVNPPSTFGVHSWDIVVADTSSAAITDSSGLVLDAPAMALGSWGLIKASKLITLTLLIKEPPSVIAAGGGDIALQQDTIGTVTLGTATDLDGDVALLDASVTTGVVTITNLQVAPDGTVSGVVDTFGLTPGAVDNVVITVTDPDDLSGSDTLRIDITDTPNQAPQFISLGTIVVKPGDSTIVYDVAQLTDNGPLNALTVVVSSLAGTPSGTTATVASFNTITGEIAVRVTVPANARAGEYTIQLQADDGSLSTNGSITLTVERILISHWIVF